MFITGPIPPYSNPPINPQFYQPSRFQIENVTLGQYTVVTATENMNYVIGQLVRLLIPQGYGCRQLNEAKGYVVSIPAADQVILDINSEGGNPFISASSTFIPQILAIGDINTGYQAQTPNNVPVVSIPGAFINISPS
jgi:hypothetical protein